MNENARKIRSKSLKQEGTFSRSNIDDVDSTLSTSSKPSNVPSGSISTTASNSNTARISLLHRSKLRNQQKMLLQQRRERNSSASSSGVTKESIVRSSSMNSNDEHSETAIENRPENSEETLESTSKGNIGILKQTSSILSHNGSSQLGKDQLEIPSSYRPPLPTSRVRIETEHNLGKNQPSTPAVAAIRKILHSKNNEQGLSNTQETQESSPPTLPPPRSLKFTHDETPVSNKPRPKEESFTPGKSYKSIDSSNQPQIHKSNIYSSASGDIPKTPAAPSSPLRDIKDLLSSVSNINRTYNTPLPSDADNRVGSKIKISAALQKRFPNLLSTPKEPIVSSAASIESSVSGSSAPSSSAMRNRSVLSSTREPDGGVTYVLPKTPSRESLFSRNSGFNLGDQHSQSQHDDNSLHDYSHQSGSIGKNGGYSQFDDSPESIFTPDSLCIKYNSEIQLKAHATNCKGRMVSLKMNPKHSSIYSDINKENDEDEPITQRFVAGANGSGLGSESEIFKIVESDVFNVTDNGPSMAYRHELKQGKQKLDKFVCYGDTIAFISGIAYDRALGVRKYDLKTEVAEFQQTQYEMGFFRSLLGQAEKWTILFGGDRKDPVEIGVGADDSSFGNEKMWRRPVRSGEAIVLRNILTGGLLAIQQQEQFALGSKSTVASDMSLFLLTNIDTARATNDLPTHPSSETFRFLNPGRFETWQISQVNTPPCPKWNSLESERYFLNGRHLLYPKRNEKSEEIEILFHGAPGSNRAKATDQSNRGISSPISLGSSPLDKQESLLLDEVIGALMGLEGNFVKIDTRVDESNFNSTKANGAFSSNRKGSSWGLGFTIDEFSASIPLKPTSLHDIFFVIVESNDDKEKVVNEEHSTKVHSKMDSSLYHLVQQILPLATNFSRVNAFALNRRARYEYGLMAHALCSSINSLLQEYLIFVCQMEHLNLDEKLTMQKLWCFIQPSLRTMQILYDIVQKIHMAKGGALLNILETMLLTSYEGDERAHQILRFLIQQTAEPYMDILSFWIHTGRLYDPYGEFFICTRNKDRKNFLDGDNWNSFYCIRENHIIRVLREISAEDIPNKILTTGKYLNSVRHSDQPSISSLRYHNSEAPKRISFDMGPIKIGEEVQCAFNQSAIALQKLILKEHGLVDHLLSMKRYFLLSQGDFFVQFLDLAEDELLQEISKVSKGRIQSLLTMAMQLGSSQSDRFRDALQCDFAACSIVNDLDSIHANNGGINSNEPRTPKRRAYGSQTELTGIEAFMLDYEATWPLSLVMSKKATASYQLIFRHLFFSKHVERRLFETWLDHQTTKELNLRSILGQTYLLRQRMLHFMQNFVYYIMFEVIEPHWHKMKKKIESSRTFDEVLGFHNEFLAVTQEQCLLKNRNLLMTLTKIMQTCLLFSDQMKRFAKSTKLDEENMKIAVEERQKRYAGSDKPKKMRSIMVAIRNERKKRILVLTERMQKAILSDNYQRMIERFIQVFDVQLKEFMRQLMADSHVHYHSHLSNLSTRLDFNGYVTRLIKIR